MFKFASSPAYWWPVTILVAAEDAPGTFQKIEFEAQFARRSVSELTTWQDKVKADNLDDNAFVKPLVVGFRKLLDVDDNEVPFNEASFAELLGVPGAGTCLARAYFDSINQAAQKN